MGVLQVVGVGCGLNDPKLTCGVSGMTGWNTCGIMTTCVEVAGGATDIGGGETGGAGETGTGTGSVTETGYGCWQTRQPFQTGVIEAILGVEGRQGSCFECICFLYLTASFFATFSSFLLSRRPASFASNLPA